LLKDQFQWFFGTATGWCHLLKGIGNQDAWTVKTCDEGIVAVIADGCSSIPHPEVGAWFGVDTISELIMQAVLGGAFNTTDGVELEAACQKLFTEIIACFDRLVVNIAQPASAGAQPSHDSKDEVIQRYMFFTMVAAIVTESATIVISFGDGVFAINDKVTEIQNKGNRNSPPYLGFHMDGCVMSVPSLPQYHQIQIQAIVPTAEVDSLLIGTDGCLDVIAAENQLAPRCRKKTIGSISQLWRNHKLFFRIVEGEFGSDSAISIWLRKLSSRIATRLVKPRVGAKAPSYHSPLYPKLGYDDITLVVLRRKK